MIKLAIFCEGMTEQLFAERLVTSVMGRRALVTKSIIRGKRGHRALTRILGTQQEQPHHEFYVQILDSGRDESVASDVRDQYSSLTGRGGFSAIIAIRDVYPLTHAQIPKLRSAVGKYIPTRPIRVTWVLAVMEIEAWFLAEQTHFARINADLTPDHVRAALGHDPATDDMQTLEHPAVDLDRVYQSVGEAYSKTHASISRTVASLDIERVYLELGERYPTLKELNDSVDAFMESLA